MEPFLHMILLEQKKTTRMLLLAAGDGVTVIAADVLATFNNP